MPKQTKTNLEESIQEIIGDDETFILYDGLDDAVIGTAERINLSPVVAYDIDKVIEILMTRDDMTMEEATEHFDFNIIGGWNGDKTPIFIRKINQ